MAKAWTPLRFLVFLVMLTITPLIYIAAFNYFFAADIAYSVDNWLLAFLAGILVFILFIALLLVAMGGFAIAGPIGAVFALAAIFSLPLLFIFSFNLLLGVAVPYTVNTYLLVGATMVGVYLLSQVIEQVRW
jgi:hypothetical protein